ncbi:MAG: hypothetical protein AAF488_12835 [Planctomycetota bacterium]
MIETRNVTGAQGARIRRDRYEAMRTALLAVIPKRKDGIPFRDLASAVEARLPGGELPGGGSIMWYVTTVKLDLEARELIERVPGSKPQRLRRASPQ